jgi:hypothetical protein
MRGSEAAIVQVFTDHLIAAFFHGNRLDNTSSLAQTVLQTGHHHTCADRSMPDVFFEYILL